MAMKPREKLLAGVVLGLVAILGVYFLGSFVLEVFNPRAAQRERLLAEVAKKKAKFDKSQLNVKKLAAWREHALPSDPKAATSLYANWLLGLTDRVRLRNAKVDAAEPRAMRDIGWKHPFTVRGQASLGQLTEFLYRFYSAGHLHQIRRLSLKPVENSQDLDISISIEALSLADADRKDKLATVKSTWQPKGDLDAYRKAIVDRNVFVAYERRPDEPDAPDAAKNTFVTAILEVGGKPQVWLQTRGGGPEFKLSEGDPVEAGSVHGKVVRIGQRDVELEIGEQRRVVKLGASLAEETERRRWGRGGGRFFGPPGGGGMPFGPPGGGGMPFGPRGDGERRGPPSGSESPPPASDSKPAGPSSDATKPAAATPAKPAAKDSDLDIPLVPDDYGP